MPVTVVVGGQFGSEGKGKVAHYLSKVRDVSIAIRVGGPNSGHTVVDDSGRTRVFQQLPTAAILPGKQCVLPAGSYIQPGLLLKEIAEASIDPALVHVDPFAVVISEENLAQERLSTLQEAIGSTNSGTGAAVLARLARTGNVLFAKDHPAVASFIRPVQPLLRSALSRGERALIEGTQGFGLSPLHSPHYPYVTSRDTTASGFLSEAGLSPLDVDEIALVLRVFPIRVAGNSGPLPNETNWDEVTRCADRPQQIIEYTTVTKKVRRVGQFDPEIVKLAITHNQPTHIFLNHLDYIGDTAKGRAFIEQVEAAIERPINYIGLGAASVLPR